MRGLTELFIRRPVLSLVVSILILLAGLRGMLALPVQQFPATVSATIQIQTTYYGADAATVAGFITTPIENAVAQADGIDYLVSQSQTSTSTVTLYLRLNQDPAASMSQVQAYVNSVTNQLPQGFQTPVITLTNNSPDVMDIGVLSNVLSPEQASDYVARVIQPQLQAVTGVQNVQNELQMNRAVRIWLDPRRIASYGISANDVATALGNNDYVTGVGQTLGGTTYINLAITSGLHDVAAFRQLVVKRIGTSLIRLGDVARVEYGPDNNLIHLATNKGAGAFISIHATPRANMLATANALEAVVAQLKTRLPPGLVIDIAFDTANTVRASLREVELSLAESLAIVALVIFLFLGSVRSVLIPLVTIPLSLIGTFALMAGLGFSINTLTLLALVLAIGLVVDDAIIIVENVNRHLADGMMPVNAAVLAARELAAPIVAMTVVLIAAYLPIGLQKGLTGALFTEFAFTLACSVTVSAILALTLSPMMSSVMLRPHHRGSRLVDLADRVMHLMQRVYGAMLRRVLDVWPVMMVVVAAVVVAVVFMFNRATHELAPTEDADFLIVGGQVPPDMNVDSMVQFDPSIIRAFATVPEGVGYFLIDQPGAVQDGMILKPQRQRHRTSAQIAVTLQSALWRVAGVQLAAYQFPSLPGSQGMPIQFVVKGSSSIGVLAEASDRLLLEARRSGLFAYIDKDLKIDQPQTTIELDRARIAELNLQVSDIGNSLSQLLGGGYVNYFSQAGRSYKVEPLVLRERRLNPEQVLSYPIATVGGIPVPLSAVAHLSRQVVPEQIAHFQQLNATTLQGIPAPGVTVGAAYAFLQARAAADLPSGFATDTAGPLREYVTEQGSFLPSFVFAMAIIFLALAALFESFRDPVIIMVAVPMSLAGALLFVWLGLGGASINLYSEIGLVTLAGLISKHGILLVEVANEHQKLGWGKRAAIERAASLRLRPILMTTAAMVLGVMPLVLATGAGAAARYAMGLVIASGLAIGTVFTLFVVPSMYMLVAARHRPDAVAHGARLTETAGAATRG